jgi:hypothetical protein
MQENRLNPTMRVGLPQFLAELKRAEVGSPPPIIPDTRHVDNTEQTFLVRDPRE